MKPKITHIDEKNRPSMVDVSSKRPSVRVAAARVFVEFPDEAQMGIEEIMKINEAGDILTSKGAVFHTAIIAGTQAVKQTSSLIPFCHQVGVESCQFEIEWEIPGKKLRIDCRVGTTGKTGVEMESMTGAIVAALTVYDMCKAISHGIRIEGLHLVKKTGGKSDFESGN